MSLHARIWAFIDQLAEESSLSVSGLARKAGLNSTTFNKSKRTGVGGRQRWPSTESLAKIMNVTGVTVDDVIKIVTAEEGQRGKADAASHKISLPFITLSNALMNAARARDSENEDSFEDKKWGEMQFPALMLDGMMALEVNTHNLMPLYHEGDTLIIDRQAHLRKYDKIVLCLLSGLLISRILIHQTDKILELKALESDQETEIVNISDIDWVGRVMWLSQ